MRNALVLAAVVLVACALLVRYALSRFSRATRGRVEIRNARVVARDTSVGEAIMLYDVELGLRGKPDYLLEQVSHVGERLVPLEVKPLRRSSRLYESDRIQIGGYLVALRGSFRDRASTIGYVQYKSTTFEVELTRDLEAKVRGLVDELRDARHATSVHRSHDSAARCRNCPVQHHCDEKLGEKLGH